MCKNDIQHVVLYVFPKDAGTTDQLLIKSAREYLGADDGLCISVARSQRGAPGLQPEGMPKVSASHSGDYTVCAISDGEVGVDLQKTDRLRSESEEAFRERLLRMANRFFHPDDAQWIKADVVNRFFTVWSAKEAYVKYTKTGIDDNFSSFRVIPKGGPFGSAWECEGVFYQTLPFEEGYSLCICTPIKAHAETAFEG